MAKITKQVQLEKEKKNKSDIFLQQDILSININFQNKNFFFENEHIIELYWIEDIYSFSMSGKLKIFDVRGILEYGPFIGEETLKISYGKEERKEKYFIIHSIDRIKQQMSVGTNLNTIEITFSEPHSEILRTYSMSKSWPPKSNIGNMIKDICDKMLGVKLNSFEEINTELNSFYSSGVDNVLDSLKYLIRRGRSKENQTAGFFLYSNSDGFHLQSAETLLTKKQKSDSNYVFEDDNQMNLNRIIAWEILGPQKDSFKMLSGRIYSGYDIRTKKSIYYQGTYQDAIEKYTILGNKSLFQNISSNYIQEECIGDSDKEILKNVFFNDWIKLYLIQNMVTLIVPFSESRVAGDIIDIEWPSNDNSQKYEKQLSGNYLIKSITHYVSKDFNPPFIQKLVCIKNGRENTEEVLYNAKKKRVG